LAQAQGTLATPLLKQSWKILEFNFSIAVATLKLLFQILFQINAKTLANLFYYFIVAPIYQACGVVFKVLAS